MNTLLQRCSNRLRAHVMVICVCISLCGGFASPVYATITLVQKAQNIANAATSITATFTSTPTQNNLLIAIAANRDANSSGPDTPAGWSVAISEPNNAPGMIIFYKVAGAAESKSIAVSNYGTGTRLGLMAFEYSGIRTLSPLDQTTSNSGNGTTPSSGTTGTTTWADELLIVGVVVNANAINNGFASWTNSFTEERDFANGGNAALISAYGAGDRIVTTTGTYSSGATSNNGGDWRGQIATFKGIQPTYEQSGYRWFSTSNNTNVGTPFSAANTAASAAAKDSAFRLRLLLHVGANQMIGGLENFKLQFAPKNVSCAASTYADVASGSGAIRFYDNSTPSDGANLTSNANDPTHNADTVVTQTYEEVNNFTNTTAAIPSDQDGEWDFSLVNNAATVGTSYCFKVVKSDGSDIDTYTQYPEIVPVRRRMSSAE